MYAKIKHHLAPRQDVYQWLTVSFLISSIMLVAVTGLAQFASPTDYTFSSNLLNRNGTLDIAWTIFTPYLLVLAIHLAACTIGIIVGDSNEVQEKPKRKSRYLIDRKLPDWMARGALLYGLGATLTSVAIQTLFLSRLLASLSASINVSPWKLSLLVLPHALLELTGLFLPLALFLIQAQRQDLRSLRAYTIQVAVIAIPMVFAAALIEAFLTPQLIYLVTGH